MNKGTLLTINDYNRIRNKFYNGDYYQNDTLDKILEYIQDKPIYTREIYDYKFEWWYYLAVNEMYCGVQDDINSFEDLEDKLLQENTDYNYLYEEQSDMFIKLARADKYDFGKLDKNNRVAICYDYIGLIPHIPKDDFKEHDIKWILVRHPYPIVYEMFGKQCLKFKERKIQIKQKIRNK